MAKFFSIIAINVVLLVAPVLAVGARTPAPVEDTTQQAAQPGTFCDEKFVGGAITLNAAFVSMDTLLSEIHQRFGINFVYGADIASIELNTKASDIPWTDLLRSELSINAIRAKCVSDRTIELMKSDKLKEIQAFADVKTEFIKLKYLQPSVSGTVDVAGRSGGGGNSGGGGSGQGCSSGGSGGGSGQGCGNFEKVLDNIRKILGVKEASQNDGARFDRGVMHIPGRNILMIRGGSQEEIDLIKQVIEKADRPPFQIIVKGLVYTANENKALDVGVQSSIIASTAAARQPGQGSTGTSTGTGTGSSTGGGTGTGTGTTTASSVPLRSVGIGYQTPTPGNLFDILALVGTVDFNLQANALATKGIISVKSRPFAMVLDGQQSELNIGRQIPVIIQAQNNLGTGSPGQLQILAASNILQIQPFVLDNDKGEPVGVNLGLRFEANDVDLSVTSQGVPSINRQSIQTNLMLGQDKTIILGGFTVDSESNNNSKVPGLGDIPGLGWLFKRKVKSNQMNRLYFAISVSVVPFGSVIEPVVVPGVTTDIPTPNIK